MSVTSRAARPARKSPVTGVTAIIAAIAAAAVAASILDGVIAVIAHAAGISRAFPPLQIGSFVSLTVLGVAAGAAGWSLVRSRAAAPARALARLVPVVLALSFIPDVLVGVTRAFPHTTWGGIAALMVMHVAVAVTAVASYRFFLPVASATQTPAARR